MLTDPILTPAEQAETMADHAFEEYAAALQVARAKMDDPTASHADRVAASIVAARAERTWRDLFLAMDEPTPPALEKERNRLACEGVLLLSLICAFVGLFLPDLEANFWPLAITFAVVAFLGGWSVHFTGRLGQHIGRRL